MKKVLLVFIFAASVSALSAQVQLGIKAGGNYSNIVGSDGDGAKAIFGFNAGVVAQLPIIDGFSIQPEAVYSMQGAKATEAGMADFKIKLNYINVPVLAKYTTASGFFIETGPQIGFLMSAKATQGSDKEDVKQFFKKTDFSWVGGIGYMSPANVGFNLRYNMGLSKLQEDATKTYNGVFQAGITYMLSSGK